MTMPNFLIIGAAKSGTTSLYHYLGQHPEIYMSPIKEPHFFALEGQKADFGGPDDGIVRNAIIRIEDYRALFQEVSNERAIGEASTSYLYDSKAPRRIRHHVPDVKLVAILRNPVDRAYSNFLYMTRRQLEPLPDFEQALREEEARIRNHWSPGWHYKQRGFYFGQLQRYFSLFEPRQIGVWLYEDLNVNPTGLVQSISQFLGIENSSTPDVSTKHNISGLPTIQMLDRLLRNSKPIKALVKPLLPVTLRSRISKYLRSLYVVKPLLPFEIRRQLINEYREDILKLQDLIQRDLSAWIDA